MSHPDDWASVSDAAESVDRSIGTVQSWLSREDGPRVLRRGSDGRFPEKVAKNFPADCDVAVHLEDLRQFSANRTRRTRRPDVGPGAPREARLDERLALTMESAERRQNLSASRRRIAQRVAELSTHVAAEAAAIQRELGEYEAAIEELFGLVDAMGRLATTEEPF